MAIIASYKNPDGTIVTARLEIVEEELYVLEIEGPEEVIIGAKAEYKVKKLSCEATTKEKKNVRWAVEIDNDQIIELKDRGEKIKIEFPEEWRGLNVRILSYITDMEDEAYFDVTTIKYFKKKPKISGLTARPNDSTCVASIMAYVNNALGGDKDINFFLNYYKDNYLKITTLGDAEAYIRDPGVYMEDIDSFIDDCFETDSSLDMKESINKGYPIMVGKVIRIDNAHCLAIIGYTSDRRFKVIDPEKSEEQTVIIPSLLFPYREFLYYKPIIKNKKL